MKAFLVVILVFCVSGCSDHEALNAGSKINIEEIQNALIRELEVAEIRYRIDNDGFLRYEKKHENIVNALTLDLLQKYSLKEEKKYGFKFEDSSAPVPFLAFLHRHGIDMNTVKHVRDENQVLWQKKDHKKISELLDQFIVEYREWQQEQGEK